MAYCTNIHLLGVQHDETKAPAGFLQRAGRGCLSIGGEKVSVKYHIFFVETRPILGAGFFVGQKLGINWARIGHDLDKWAVKIWYDFNRNGGMQDV